MVAPFWVNGVLLLRVDEAPLELVLVIEEAGADC
jgi:hypothetical protein